MLTVNNSVNFRAVPVAKVKPLAEYGGKEITLFKLNESDEKFLQKMLNNINLRKLLPKETKNVNYNKWKGFIKSAASRVNTQNVVLAVQDKRPCGIMAFRKENESSSYLSFIATWPTKPYRKARFAGQALIRELFQYNVDTNRKNIELFAAPESINGKRCIDFYKKLGFDKSPIYADMLELKDTDFSRKSAQIENFFKYERITNGKNVNLCKTLRRNLENPFEKLINLFKL